MPGGEGIDLGALSQQLSNAIGLWEWRGRTDDGIYTNDGGQSTNYTGAMGRYQFTPPTLADDSRRYLGREVTPSEFISNPRLQDNLMQLKTQAALQRNLQKYGNITDAIRFTAIDHYGHNPDANGVPQYNRKAPNGYESPNQYAFNVMRLLDNGSAQQFTPDYTGNSQPSQYQLQTRYSVPYPSPKDDNEYRQNQQALQSQKAAFDAEDARNASATIDAVTPQPAPPSADQVQSQSLQDRVSQIKSETSTLNVRQKQKYYAESVALANKMREEGAAAGVQPLYRPDFVSPVPTEESTGPMGQVTGLSAYRKNVQQVQSQVNAAQAELIQQPSRVGQLPGHPENVFPDVAAETLRNVPGLRGRILDEAQERQVTQLQNKMQGEGTPITREQASHLLFKEQAKTELSKQGLLGNALAGLLDIGAEDKAVTAFMEAGDAATGGLLREVNPGAFRQMESMTEGSAASNLLTRTLPRLAGTIVGLKATGKILEQLAPLAESGITSAERTGLTFALHGAPTQAVQVVKGEKSPLEAAGEAGVSFAQGATLEPIFEAAKGLGERVPDVFRSLTAQGANVVGQTLQAGGTQIVSAMISGNKVDPMEIASQAATNIILSSSSVRTTPLDRLKIQAESLAAQHDATVEAVFETYARKRAAEARGDDAEAAKQGEIADRLNAGRAEAKKAYDEVTKTIGETESIANAKKSGTPTVDARGQVLKLFSLPKKAKGTEFEGPKPLEAPQGEAAQNEPSQAQTAETPKPEFRGNTYLTGQGRLVTAIGEPGENKQVRVRETREGGDYIFYTPVRSLRQVNEGTEKVFGDIVYEHQYDPGTEIVTQTPEGVPENRNTTDKMGEIYFSRRGERQHFSAIMGDGTEVNPIIATPKAGGDPFVILRSQNSADAEAMIEQNLGMKPEDVTLRNVNENDLRSFLSNKPLEQEQQNANAGSPKGGIEKTGEQGSLPEHQGEGPGTAAPENSGEIRGEESSRSGRGGSGKRGTQQKQTEEGQVENLSARRKRAKDIAAVLSEPPQSPAEAAMHFILGGGRFNLFDVRKQALGSNAKPVAGGDIGPEYLHIANNKGTSIDRFVHDIMPEYLGREQGDIDEVNARNEILDMLTTVRSQSDIIGKVREFRAQNQPPEWAEEQRRREEDPAYRAFAESIDRLSTKQTEENLGQPAVLEPEGEELAFERSSKGKQRPLKYLANARSLTGEELIGEIDAGGKVYDQMVKAAKTGDENALMKLSDEIYNETKNFFDNIETKSYKEGAKKPIAYSRGTPERTTHFSEIYDKYIDPSYRLTEQEFNDVKKTKGFKLAASQGGQDYSDYIMTNLRRLRDIQILLDLPKERQLQYAELTSKEFSDEARHLYYSQPESEDISYEKGSRIPPGGKTKQGKGYKITEIDPFEDPAGYAEERAKYNPREYKFGEKVYRYDPEGGVLQAPELGTIKRATIMGAEVPAFVSEDTKKASLIDENVMRRGEAHPLTRLGQYPIDAQTATNDVTHVPTDADNMIPPLIHNFAEEIAAAYGGDVNFKLFRNNKALGFLSHRPPKSEFGTPTVALDRRIFADPNLVARVLTHEIGHLDDYSGPDTFTTKRGTLLDRIKTLKAPTAEIGITNKALRQELVNLTNKWKPFDPAANADYTAYRYKAAELYADFVSATILDPKFAMEVAPGFSQEYFKKMDERPVVKEAYEQMRANLDPTTDTFQEASLARTRAAMAEGKVRLAEKRYDEREAAKGVRGSLLPQGDYKTTQAFNFFEPVNRLAAEREATAYKMLKNAGLKKEYAEFVRLHNLKERNAADPVSLASAIAEQETRLGDAKMEKLWKARSLLDNFSMGFHAARFAVQDYRLSNESKAAIADDFDGFLDKARALGVEEDVGIYLKNTAITGTHRAGVAQPNLETPESAARQLAYMKKSLGEEKYAAIEQAASDIRASQFEELQAFAKSGLISEEKLKELSANKDSYAKFQAVLSDEISAHYSREGVKGMLTETHDPALTALLQQMSMRQAILTNEAKKASIGLIKEAEDVRKFSRQFGRGRHSALPTIEEAPVRKMDAITREERYAKPPRGHDVLEVYEGGKRKGYIVDQYMADIFNKAPYSVERNWDWWTNYLKFQRGVFITYNPNFTFQNFFRDAGKGLASTGFGIVKNYPEATRASYRMTKGVVDPMADEAARAGVLNYSNRSNWENEFGGRIQPIDKVLRTPEERRGAFMRTTRALGHLAENYTPIGMMRTVLETTEGSHKIAAYNTFLQQGFSSREAAYMSRLHVGTPDGSISGFLSNRLNRTFMFTKMTMNAWMSDFELVRNPYTRAGFVARSMLTTIIPRTLQFMAAKGMLTVLASAAFGDDDQKTQYFRDVENEFADIPSYDLSNYQIVPLGLISNNIGHFKGEQGKSMRRYLRFATDQNITTAAASVQRAIGAIADGRSWDAVREIASQSYGDLPGMTPLLDASWSWMEYLFNQKNPYDNFRNKNVISDQAMQASQGLAGPAKNELARWTLEKLLGTTYQTLYRGPKRLIEQYTHPDSISSEPLRIMGYSEAEAGVTERKAAIEGAARESAATSYETKQILRRGDPEEIAKAREQGVVTEKQFTDFLKTTAEAPDEKKLKQLSVQQVQELTKVALHRRDTSYVQILGPILGQKMQNFQEHPEKYTEKTKKTVFENDSVLNQLYLQYQNSLRQGGGR